MSKRTQFQKESQCQLLFDIAPDAIFIADVESGIILDANKSAANLLDIPVDEIIGMHQSKLHPAQETERYKQLFQKHIEQGSGVFSENLYVSNKDGRNIPVQINMATAQLDDKKVIFGIFRDITQQKQLWQDLEISETRFKRLADAAFEAIVIHEQGNVVDVNQRYLDLFGCTYEEARTIPWLQFVAPQSRKFVEEKVAEKYEGIYETFAIKKDGTIFPVQIHAKELVMNGRPVRIAAVRDLTVEQQHGELLTAVFNSSQDCIIVFDRDYNHLYMNQAAKDYAVKISGRKATGNMLDTLPYIPEFLTLWKDRIDEVFKTGQSMHFEDTFSIADQIFFGDSTLSPARYPGGDIFAASLVYRDVTEQRKAEAQIRAANEQFRSLMKGIVDPAAILDTEGCYSFMNDEGLRRLGLTLDQVVGKHIREIFGEESYQAHSPTLQKVLETQTSQFVTEQLNAQGETRWYQTGLHPIKNADGQITNILSISHDIHDETMLKEKIKESEKKYQELYDNAHVALFRTTLDGTLLHCNNACLSLFGCSPEETIEDYINTLSVTERYVDPARREAFIQILKEKKRVKGFEAELIKNDASTVWISFTAEIYPEAGFIEGALYDITVQKVLSKTEKGVLSLLMEGQTNKQIARKLDRSVRTIEDHRASIMRKLGVDNAFELTRKALELGFYPEDQ